MLNIYGESERAILDVKITDNAWRCGNSLVTCRNINCC